MHQGDFVVRVYLLGTPTVQVEHRLVILARRQVRALLYRLAADPQPVARGSLCFAFWPDQPEEVGRSKLSRLLTLLHQSLPAADLVLASTDHVWLNSTRVWTDVRACLGCWGSWLAHRQVADLEQFMALYGGTFLDGFSLPQAYEFEAWMLHTREHLQRLLAETLQSIIAANMQQGAYAAALSYAQKAVETDELNEAAQQQLLELYIKTGDRHAALQQYERFAHEMRRELDLEPMPATRQYYNQLHIAPKITPEITPETALHAMPDTTPSNHAPCREVTPTVRAGILAQLLYAVRQTNTLGSHVILLQGEPGSGKTWCLQKICAQARPHAAVLAVRCRCETRRRPLQAFRHLLAPDTNGAEAVPAVERFAEIAQAVLACAEKQQALLLAVDDLHWGDQESINLLAYLLHQPSRLPVLLIGTWQSGAGDNVELLAERLDSRTSLQEMELPALRPEEIREFVPSAAEWSAADCAAMAAYCGGNPFYLMELLHAVPAGSAGGRLHPADLWINLPPTLCAAVRHRLRRLNPPARQAIEFTAVAGGACLASRLMLPSTAAQMLDGLEEAIRCRLLQETAGEVDFRHGFVREIVLGDLSTARKNWLAGVAQTNPR
jgi:DNA-binding SARP family transcriptional activator